MKKLSLALLALASLSVLPAQAGSATVDSKDFKETKNVSIIEECRFRDLEWQFDGFYTGFFGGRYMGGKNSSFKTGSGGGFGVNFFFAKYFGVGYEAAWYSNGGTAEHMPLGGNVYFRYPICKWNIAPYAMVGGGVSWDGYAKGYGNVGGGIEYRVTKNVGIFVDSRFFYGGTGNVTNLRSGLRFAF
jgi:hypothetical protein